MVPIGAGAASILLGPQMVQPGFAEEGYSDSHFRCLFAFLLRIAIAFLSAAPGIGAQSARFRLLTGTVVVGGIAD